MHSHHNVKAINTEPHNLCNQTLTWHLFLLSLACPALLLFFITLSFSVSVSFLWFVCFDSNVHIKVKVIRILCSVNNQQLNVSPKQTVNNNKNKLLSLFFWYVKVATNLTCDSEIVCKQTKQSDSLEDGMRKGSSKKKKKYCVC